MTFDFSHLVSSPSPVIFDVGANQGQSIELFRSQFPGCTIHAFEPDAEVFGALSRRFATTQGLVLNNLGIASRCGVMALHRNTRHATNSFLSLNDASDWRRSIGVEALATVPAPVTTIDRYCAERRVSKVDILKLDVQGYEPECLLGAYGMLRERRIAAVQLEIIFHPFYERPSSFYRIEGILHGLGYRLFGIHDAVAKPTGELLQLDAIYRRAYPTARA
jgi:FkbM family methyltransferase